MSGNGFGFDKGLLGPTSWAPANTTPAAPARNEAERAFQNVSVAPQRQAPSMPVWPASTTPPAASEGGTTDMSGFDSARAGIFSDPAFLAMKGSVTG